MPAKAISTDRIRTSKEGKQQLPLHYHALNGNEETLRQELETGKYDVNQPSKTQQTPLHAAARKGHADCINTLLEFGGDANLTTKKSETPLHIAVEMRHTKAVEALLYGEADINAADDSGMTPIRMAVRNGNSECLQMMLEYHYDTIEIDAVDDKGRTLLHDACSDTQNKECAELLIEQGADLNVKDAEGLVPLHLAVVNTNNECVKLLLDNNADPDIKVDPENVPEGLVPDPRIESLFGQQDDADDSNNEDDGGNDEKPAEA